MKTFNEVIDSIEPADVRYTIVPYEDLQEWAKEAVLIFQNPPKCDPVMIVEVVGRQLAERLHTRIGTHLTPSQARLGNALDGAIPEADTLGRQQLALWCEVTLHYLSEIPKTVSQE